MLVQLSLCQAFVDCFPQSFVVAYFSTLVQDHVVMHEHVSEQYRLVDLPSEQFVLHGFGWFFYHFFDDRVPVVEEPAYVVAFQAHAQKIVEALDLHLLVRDLVMFVDHPSDRTTSHQLLYLRQLLYLELDLPLQITRYDVQQSSVQF